MLFAHYIVNLMYTISYLLIIIVYFAKETEHTSSMTNSSPKSYSMIPSKAILISDETSSTGFITSPNWPEPFPINSSSYASLAVNYNQAFDTIRLSFEAIELQTSNFCESEAIEITCDDDTPGTTICGSILPKPLIISSKKAVVRFFSDAFNRGDKQGFKIKYEFLNSNTQLHDGCDLIDQFKCRNRQCISITLTCNGHDDCGDASDEDMMTPCQRLPTITYNIDYTCGLSGRNSDRSHIVDLLTNRIVGGTRAQPRNGWPFQVSIQLMNVESLSHICGGTLIHPLFVLSAAHCFKGIIPTADYKFIFGATDLRKSENNVQVRYAYTITLYPGGGLFRDLEDIGFRHVDIMNDIALIELNAPIQLSSHVWPACLPHLGETIQAGRECVASGFGDTRGTGHLFVQKQVQQQVIFKTECNSMNSDFKVDDYTMICVRNRFANGPCNGDSGGPLICADGANTFIDTAEVNEAESNQIPTQTQIKPGDLIKYLPISDESPSEPRIETKPSKPPTRYTVYGVTSFTTDGYIGGGFCGLENVPTIYARVSSKVEWILSQIKMAMSRLSKDDIQQDQHNRPAMFGYMFRSGLSRHENFTRAMTIHPT